MADTKQEVSGRERRRLAGLLVRPKEQVKFAFVFFSTGFVALGIFFLLFGYAFHRALVTLHQAYGIDQGFFEVMNQTLFTSMLVAVIFSGICALGGIFMGVKISHRIYGPLIPLERHIRSLAAGNYASRVKLRKGDQLLELRDALNELAETLEKRQ